MNRTVQHLRAANTGIKRGFSADGRPCLRVVLIVNQQQFTLEHARNKADAAWLRDRLAAALHNLIHNAPNPNPKTKAP